VADEYAGLPTWLIAWARIFRGVHTLGDASDDMTEDMLDVFTRRSVANADREPHRPWTKTVGADISRPRAR
jgi:hypothetical protein